MLEELPTKWWVWLRGRPWAQVLVVFGAGLILLEGIRWWVSVVWP